MSYRFVYPNGAPVVGAAPTAGYNVDPTLMAAGYPNGVQSNMYDDHRRRSYSPGSFSSDSESTDDYEYRGRMITRDSRCPRDVVRAPTPPPIIKRVVERAPTPEAPIMERVIIRPQPQEIVERVIEQPRTPPPRIIQKEMQEEAPPPIVRTRVIKVDRPLRSGYSQPGSPYSQHCNGLSSFSNAVVGNPSAYRARSIAGSVGRPVAYANPVDQNQSFSSGSSFEYTGPVPMVQSVQPTNMMMMPTAQQVQPVGVMQQAVPSMGVMPQTVPQMGLMQHQQQPVQQQMMYRPVQMGAQSVAPAPSTYVPQSYVYSGNQGMSFGYRPMMQQGRMIPSGMPMPMVPGNNLPVLPANNYANQPVMFNPMAQQLVY